MTKKKLTKWVVFNEQIKIKLRPSLHSKQTLNISTIFRPRIEDEQGEDCDSGCECGGTEVEEVPGKITAYNRTGKLWNFCCLFNYLPQMSLMSLFTNTFSVLQL